ncbi:hypothetical protein D9M73_150240 [compost metagenome]
MKRYSPPAKLKRSEVKAVRVNRLMSCMLASLRGLFWRNWPPYRVRPASSLEVTCAPCKVCGSERPSSARRMGRVGDHSPTLSSVLDTRILPASAVRPKSSAGRPSS